MNGMLLPQWLNRPSHGQLQASRVLGARAERDSQRSLTLIRLGSVILATLAGSPLNSSILNTFRPL